MSLVSQFNKTLMEFLTELLETFPEHKGIEKQKIKFEVGVRANCRLAIDKVVPELITHSKGVLSKDETIIRNVNGAFSEIDFVELWNSNLSENTKNVIWQYLQTLLMLGTQIFSA